jgi:hypothetical protein
MLKATATSVPTRPRCWEHLPSITAGRYVLSDNTFAALLTSLKVWNSPAGSSDNLTNRTASISSSSSLVDFAPLTDSSHCSPRSPLNTVWDPTHKAPGLGQRGYSPNHAPEWELDIIHPSDSEADLTNGMKSLVVDGSSPKPAHKSNGPLHGRAVSYAGALGVSDMQPSGMPMAAPTPTVRAVSALHHQRSDPSIAQTYAYGQLNNHDYGVYYPNVPVAGRETYNNFNQYSYGTPAADPSVFGSPVTSNTAHRMSYGMANYSTPSTFYPDTSQGPSSYYYASPQGLVYPSPQMGHAPMPAVMHSPVPGIARSKGDMQVCYSSQIALDAKFQFVCFSY